MRFRSTIFVAALLACLVPATGLAQVTAYSQDFEFLVQTDPSALANDGWLVFGNVFAPDGTTFLYPYGPFPAPNDGFGFCQIDINQGGVDQGLQQLVIFSDYNNTDHAIGNVIESNTYREWTVAAADVGKRWTFAYDAKLGNLTGASTARAFIKTLDPNNGYALTNYVFQDMTTTPATWQGYTLSIDITADLEGQILQIGFLCTASNYEGSGVYYDNLNFYEETGTAAPPSTTRSGMTLAQNSPNPFNPTTRIEFSLEQAGPVELSVYDLAGRRVATLENRVFEAGSHESIWDGRTDAGARVASGQYRYVLRTRQGEIARGMTLIK